MANKMLIDAMHPEETRVVVLRGSRIEEFDFESASKRQLRGNIYLAKVIRVEPSLQAAFVDYGGNRHGFLAFSEIHPDYYQIPVSDRAALLAEEEQDEPEEEERRPRRSRRRRGRDGDASGREAEDETATHDVAAEGTIAAAAAAGHIAAEDGFAGETTEDAHAAEEHGARAQAAVRRDQADKIVSEAIEVAAQDRAEPQDAPEDAAASGAASEAAGDDTVPAARQAPIDLTAALIERADEAHARETLPIVDEARPAEPAIASDAPAAEGGDAYLDAAEHAALVTAPAAAGEGQVATDAAVDMGSTVAAAMHADEPIAVQDDALARQDIDETVVGEAVVEEHGDEHADEGEHEEEQVEHVGGDALEEVPRRVYRPRRQYKIQEVIKRRQVLLVQVVKEERGNKGAALTTYLSLAGRYSVLMPNTARGGGISRKITDAGDRQRLKTIAQDLEVPDGMGVILRTAGASRTKPEVKRDFEYLMRAWETVRETTLASTAPTLVYEEGSLIKRAIRDLYNSDVEEIVVAGEEGYREAKAFMRLLQPSHLRNVVAWRDPAPLFAKNGAEAQLDAMFHNHVTLKSGGYLVINQTEALVAIDVNSGRSTREHNIEDTALRTNLEAADEVARQLRLRDLAGLIVVDFIDMEEGRNNRAVEKRMKDALKDDRARIQIGRISHFGLLEMSRQRIRTGVLEGSTEACPHCAGAGTVRSTASIALFVLRALEEALLADRSRDMTVRTRGGVALYILNNKRSHLTGIEERFGVAITFAEDASLIGTSYCGFDKGEPASGVPQMRALPPEEIEDEFEPIAEDEVDETPVAADGEDGEPRRKRRRRRGRGRDAAGEVEREVAEPAGEEAPQPSDEALAILGGHVEGGDPIAEEQGTRRRRSRRGGRRSRGEGREEERAEQTVGADGEPGTGEEVAAQDESSIPTAIPAMTEVSDIELAHPAVVDEAPMHGGTPESTADTDAATVEDVVAAAPGAMEIPVDAEVAEPASQEPASAEPAVAESGEAVEVNAVDPVPVETPMPKRPEPVSSELDPSRPKRSGWWSRAKATLGG